MLTPLAYCNFWPVHTHRSFYSCFFIWFLQETQIKNSEPDFHPKLVIFSVKTENTVIGAIRHQEEK